MIESEYIQEEKLYIYREHYRAGMVIGGKFGDYFTKEDKIMHAEWEADTSSRSSSLTLPTALYFLEDELNEPEYFQQKSPWFGVGSCNMIKVPVLYKGEKHWAWVSKAKLENLSREDLEKLEEIISQTKFKRGFFEESVLKEDNSFDELKELFNNDMNRFSEVIKDYLRLPNRDACEKIFNRTAEQMTCYNCLLIFVRWAGYYWFDNDNFEAFKGLVNNDSRFNWRRSLKYYVDNVYEYQLNSKILKLLKHIANDDNVTDSDVKEFHDVIENLENLTAEVTSSYSPFYCGDGSDFYIRTDVAISLKYNPKKWIDYINLINYLDSLTESSLRRGFFAEDLSSRKIDKEIPSEEEIIRVMKSDKTEEQKCQELFGVNLLDLQRLNKKNYESEECPLDEHYQGTYREVRGSDDIGYWSLFINSSYGEPEMNLTQSYYHYCFCAYWPEGDEHWYNRGHNCKCTAWWAHMEATIEWWAEQGDNIRKTVRGFFDD